MSDNIEQREKIATPSNGTKPQKIIQSVERALNILEYIAENGNKAGLTEISKGLGLSKSTVHGLIATLEQMGYIQQHSDSGKYSLGLKLFQLGMVVYNSMDLRTIALPHLHVLADKYKETVHLAVLSEGEVVYIEKVDSPRSIRIVSRIGGRNPAHCTGVGKVLLAALPEEALDRLLAKGTLHRYTNNTITNPLELKKHLQEVREKGVAFDLEEFERGLRCVAAPIRNHRGTVIAAISVSGPSNRLVTERLAAIADDVIGTANTISRGLGLG